MNMVRFTSICFWFLCLIIDVRRRSYSEVLGAMGISFFFFFLDSSFSVTYGNSN